MELEEEGSFLFRQRVIEAEFTKKLVRGADGHDFEDSLITSAIDAGFYEIATDSAALVAVIDGEALDFAEFSRVDFNGCKSDDLGFALFKDFGDESVGHQQNQFGLHSSEELALFDEGLEELLDRF